VPEHLRLRREIVVFLHETIVSRRKTFGYGAGALVADLSRQLDYRHYG